MKVMIKKRDTRATVNKKKLATTEVHASFGDNQNWPLNPSQRERMDDNVKEEHKLYLILGGCT